METAIAKIRLRDYHPQLDAFRDDVLRGLRQQPKRLPCKWFYDELGSQLFERICKLEEYYLTRSELEILRRHAAEMAMVLGPRCRLVEYGSGSGIKIRILLEHLDDPAAYVPLDISREYLMRSAARLAADHPHLSVLPVCADYTAPFGLPNPERPARRTVAFFPGSTIGNFEPEEAVAFLRGVAATCADAGGLLIGVDLKKDVRLLHAAYNDRAGVTAAFNLNVLARIKRELDADLELGRFAHHARYNPLLGRVEMRLVSMAEQSARICGEVIQFGCGETILTECSYKYSLDEFARLAGQAGFEVRRVWTDRRQWFSVQYLAVRAHGVSGAAIPRRGELHR